MTRYQAPEHEGIYTFMDCENRLYVACCPDGEFCYYDPLSPGNCEKMRALGKCPWGYA